MTAKMLRPKHAAERFDVSRKTLDRWAKDGLIGRSKVGGVVFLSASDIDDLIRSRQERRTVLPFAAQPATSTAAPAEDWRALPLWARGKP